MKPKRMAECRHTCYNMARLKAGLDTGTRSGHPEGVVLVRAPGWGSLLGWGYR
jgi:hypothetical protein